MINDNERITIYMKSGREFVVTGQFDANKIRDIYFDNNAYNGAIHFGNLAVVKNEIEAIKVGFNVDGHNTGVDSNNDYN